MIGAALLWLLVLEIFSLVAFPIAYRAFSRMPDRGWAFSKLLGLLFVGFTTWVIGLTHTIPNSRWSVLLALLIVAGLAQLASRTTRDDIRDFIRANRGTVFTVELLFVSVFLAMTLFRASVSTIGVTEQPMDFMFLNAVVTSPHYPPTDPWLAGFPVSYYYLGYVLVGSVTMLSGIATPIAYNLGLATAAAMGAIAAFGVTYNLVRLARGGEDGAIFAGIGAVFLLLVASNLVGTLELFRAAGIGGVGFWETIGVNQFTAPTGPSSAWHPEETHLWWWKTSRVVPPGEINEFPLFSFLVGDLHPHVMSIGFVLLSVGVSMQLYLQQGLLRFGRPLLGWPLALSLGIAAPVLAAFLLFDITLLWMLPVLVLVSTAMLGALWPLAVTALVATGAIAAINLWDLPLAMALVSGAILLNAARNERSFGFASSVAVSGDVMIAGAPNDSMIEPGGGAATVFVKERDRWKKREMLRPPPAMPHARFGASVDAEPRKIVVGAPGAASAFLYHQTDVGWTQRTVLRPPQGQRSDGFGRAVGIRNDVVAVASDGAVFVFVQDGGQWGLRAKLESDRADDDFGASLALGDSTLAVGAPGSNTIYWYEREQGGWRLVDRVRQQDSDGFGRSVSVSAGRLLGGSEGAADLYHRSLDAWKHETTFTSPTSAHGFGRAVALERRFAVVGAEGGGSKRARGSVEVYADQGKEWTEHAHLTAADVASDSQFGGAVAISNDTVAIGASGRGQGASYLFSRDLDQWSLDSKFASRWRLAPAATAIVVLLAGMLIALAPFWDTFDSNARGILPLLSLLTRPLHLLLLWGTAAILTLPMLAIAMRSTFIPGSLNMKRLGIAIFAGFTPVMFWLQPIYAFPLYAVAIGMYALHAAGYRMPKADETAFAYNPRATLWVGGTAVVLGFMWDGIVNAERGIEGELLAIDRLFVVVPMAIIVSLAIYGAWTLAHRDSEVLRTAPSTAHLRTTADALTPALGLFAVAATIVMGVELFHVVDSFAGGDLRRMNTMFKLGYQAWLLFAVLGGFALWYVTSRLDRRALAGRVTLVGWSAVLLIVLGAVGYYPLAAINTLAGDGATLELDGQAHLLVSAPEEHAAIAWIRDNVAPDAVVVESAVEPCANEPRGCHSYTAAGRISGSTGRPTIIGWLGHERQWRATDVHPELDRRLADVRELYASTDPSVARTILDRYEASYVIVGPRERRAYGEQGMEKFDTLGERVFTSFASASALFIYRLPPRVS